MFELSQLKNMCFPKKMIFVHCGGWVDGQGLPMKNFINIFGNLYFVVFSGKHFTFEKLTCMSVFAGCVVRGDNKRND